MHNPLFDLLGAPLVPELGSDIAAGAPGYIHLILVSVAALGAFPDQLVVLIFQDVDFAVITAALAVIAFRVQLRLHNMVINMLHHGQYGVNIILHIGHFHVADGSAGG